MITASVLAGYFAGHAIWCLSSGETLIPMFAYTTASGERKMERLALDDQAAAIAYGKSRLDANDVDANDAVLLYRAQIQVEHGPSDAIMIEMRSYYSPESGAILAVPYAGGSGGKVFSVQTPRLLACEGCADFDMELALEVFFVRGVTRHEKGARIWCEAFDKGR